MSKNDYHRDIVSFLNLILKMLCFTQKEVNVQFRCHGNNKNIQFSLHFIFVCCRTVLELQLHVYTRTDVAPMHHIPAYTWVQRGSATGPTHILPQISWSFHLHTKHCPHHNAPAQLQSVSIYSISFLLIYKIGVQTLEPWICFYEDFFSVHLYLTITQYFVWVRTAKKHNIWSLVLQFSCIINS
jgi:hypothetical protein